MKRCAVVTGGAGGIGAAIASRFAAEDFNVVVVDLKQPGRLPTGSRFFKTDVSNEDEVNNLFQDIASNEGRVDALVNNAAIAIYKPLLQTSHAEWDRIFDINVHSIYLTVRAAHQLMKERRSAIVNLASVHAVATSSGIAAYAATKGAVVALTRALAIELAPDGIRVNCILPGAIDTDMLRSGLDTTGSLDEQVKQLGQRHPTGRVGSPEEVAESVYFLADYNRSSFVTGHAFVVDGGALAQLSTGTEYF